MPDPALNKIARAISENMAAVKRARPEKGFFLSLERGDTIKAKKIKSKQVKVDTEKIYPIEVSR